MRADVNVEDLGRRAGRVAATAGGLALGLVFGATALIRRSKPLHPEGRFGTGRLVVTPDQPSGVALLDTPAVHDCEVRGSWATGAGPQLPDIEGLAVRLHLADGPADVLFASTGDGPVGRFLLAGRLPGRHATQTTLLPIRAERHALLLRARPTWLSDAQAGWPDGYDLDWAHGTGAWHSWAHLDVDWSVHDQTLRFDPLVNPLPGTEQYGWVDRLREPAYRMARRLRPDEGHLPSNPRPDGMQNAR